MGKDLLLLRYWTLAALDDESLMCAHVYNVMGEYVQVYMHLCDDNMHGKNTRHLVNLIKFVNGSYAQCFADEVRHTVCVAVHVQTVNVPLSPIPL